MFVALILASAVLAQVLGPEITKGDMVLVAIGLIAVYWCACIAWPFKACLWCEGRGLLAVPRCGPASAPRPEALRSTEHATLMFPFVTDRIG